MILYQWVRETSSLFEVQRIDDREDPVDLAVTSHRNIRLSVGAWNITHSLNFDRMLFFFLTNTCTWILMFSQHILPPLGMTSSPQEEEIILEGGGFDNQLLSISPSIHSCMRLEREATTHRVHQRMSTTISFVYFSTNASTFFFRLDLRHLKHCVVVFTFKPKCRRSVL